MYDIITRATVESYDMNQKLAFYTTINYADKVVVSRGHENNPYPEHGSSDEDIQVSLLVGISVWAMTSIMYTG